MDEHSFYIHHTLFRISNHNQILVFISIKADRIQTIMNTMINYYISLVNALISD